MIILKKNLNFFLLFFINLLRIQCRMKFSNVNLSFIFYKQEKHSNSYSGLIELSTAKNDFVCFNNINTFLTNKICSYFHYNSKISIYRYKEGSYNQNCRRLYFENNNFIL